ncbi:hypothetical protein [Streptantibioticus silvisoli]|uniref:hypothetical protein n=1 Tax=Streptantibioticus silvisoli TaxID=2705255 RepID=UPI0022FE9325|nr:hypothetical protein [Streptantibioticus silvisoli]
MAFRKAAGMVAAGLTVAVLTAGCAAGPAVPQHQPSRPRPTTVEGLAAAAGCEPAMQADRSGLREGTCLTSRGSYVMATFSSPASMRNWEAASRTSGRSLLVGTDWAVAGPAPALRPVQERLGGEVSPG